MKKHILLLLTIVSLTLINCKKDNSDNDADATKPVPVTVTSTDNSTTLLSLPQMIVNTINGDASKSSMTTTTTSNYEYDGRHLIKVTSNDGQEVKIQEYYYADMDNGILDSIVYKTDGNYSGVSKYQMTNGHIEQIAEFDQNNNLVSRVTFSNYNGDKPSHVSIFSVTQNGTIDISGTISYNGDDMSSTTLSGTYASYSISISDTYTYDNKKNVFLNVETMEMPITSSHNTLSVNTQMTFNGMPLSNETITYTYNYNNKNYPISTTISGNNTSGSMEYVYENK